MLIGDVKKLNVWAVLEDSKVIINIIIDNIFTSYFLTFLILSSLRVILIFK